MTSEEVKILLQTSSFIPKHQLTLWNHCIDLYNIDKPGLAMVLLLPLLEHALRCQFSIVNKCPGRTITAEVRIFVRSFSQGSFFLWFLFYPFMAKYLIF